MKRFYKLAGFFFILAAGVLFSEEASAAAASCTVQVRRDVNFGDYDTLATGNLDTDGRIRVRCRRGNQTPPSYTLKLGPSSGGSFTPRQMFRGAEPLNYNLYLDSARTTIWGDGTSGTSFITESPAPQNRTYRVYGRTPLGQDVSVGLYTDTITVTIEW